MSRQPMIALHRRASLTPAPRNPRTHDAKHVAQIAASIQRWGWTTPVLIDGSGQIIAGHGRVLAAEKLGIDEIPCVVVDGWTDEERRAYLIADNQLALNSGWNRELLELEMRELDGLNVDLSTIGFDGAAIDRLLGRKGTEDEVPAPPAVAVTQPGDLITLGAHRLLCGDSTCAEDVEHLLGTDRAALILGDPPYFGKVETNWDNDFDGYEDFLDTLDAVFELWAPRMADRGTCGWWCAADYAWHVEQRLRKYYAPFNHVVWTKGASLGTTVCVEDMRRWRPRSERLLLCEKQHSPDALLASFNAKTSHIASRAAYAAIIDRLQAWQKAAGLTAKEIDAVLGKNGMAGHYFGRSQWMLPTEEAWARLRPLFLSRGVDIGDRDAQRREFDAQRREFDAQRQEFDAQRREFDAQLADNLTDVWEIAAPTGAERHGHPTPKPLALVSKLVLAHARTGDVVADPFLGSGTTLIACEQLARRCFGMEIDPIYCDVIVQRWETLTGGKARHTPATAEALLS